MDASGCLVCWTCPHRQARARTWGAVVALGALPLSINPLKHVRGELPAVDDTTVPV